MMREAGRLARSLEAPIVGGLPDAPGIIVAMRLSTALATHLRGLADVLLVDDFPGATLMRGERELLATAVSAENDCYYCMDTHAAFACELLGREGAAHGQALTLSIREGSLADLSPKMSALTAIARKLARGAQGLDRADVERAIEAGAENGDVQLAILIAAAFSMYNRIVDGFRARTPGDPSAYAQRAREIADYGYSDPRTRSVPGAA
jgi:uncharacterized peroxidase-related enzyme